MSGVEFVVGVVLASVPITITILEKYSAFSEGRSVFQNPKRALKQSLTIVRTQKSIFWHNAIDLLSAITDDRDLIEAKFAELIEQARAGIGEGACAAQSPARQTTTELRMSGIYRGRISSLEYSFESCRQHIELINAALESLMKEINEISDLSHMSSSDQPAALSREWLLHKGSALKLAVRNPGLTKAVKDLSELNSMFTTITRQIIGSLNQIRKGAQNNRDANLRRTPSNINRIEKYQQIRSASAALYKTLAHTWTCEVTSHDNHTARVCCVDVPETKVAESVRFKLALSVCEVLEDESPDDDDPLWLEVEHCEVRHAENPQAAASLASRTSSNMPQDLIDDLTHRTEQFAAGHVAKKLKSTKIVRFENENPDLQTEKSSYQDNTNATDPLTPSKQSSDADANLTLLANVCNHFRLHYTNCQPQQCLGYLDGKYRQRFYRPTPDQIIKGRSMTLGDIMSWVNGRPLLKSLPHPAAFHIASSLAASVLQFHSTPWLPETWRSQDVTFFIIGETSIETDLQLSYPYFKIEFANRNHFHKGKGKARVFTSHQTAPDEHDQIISGARNELLFRLGTVLMEVAFSLPWEDLRNQARIEFQVGQQTDYSIAERLCQVLLPRKMGPEYTRIVRRCIGCDFGLTEPQIDLVRSDELQSAFLLRVVDELQRMKKGVVELGTAGT
ncbi:hypothetical protein QBC37DRAFT_398930 [Rhypophila decipiens]|uniref:DUF7580 domain-containing protein n=1 Tax=Rhypophila decipiens TaxID=261697 RepID=A0AAN6YAI0_9PEZI|nr:hypothetical protein QBC37DRAFT_398930 [Rhypophila decipiens]